MPMDLRQIKKLIDLFNESNLSEIEVRNGDDSVRLSHSTTVVHAPAPANVSAQTIAAPQSQQTSGDSSADNADTSNSMRSPMVGTFYRSPAPDAEPFVRVGDQVNKGDTVCIIEAMKMMNRIDADRSGTIKSILIENAEPVEFDQPLLVIV